MLFPPALLKKGAISKLNCRLGHRIANEGPGVPAALVPLFEQQKPQGSSRVGQFWDSEQVHIARLKQSRTEQESGQNPRFILLRRDEEIPGAAKHRSYVAINRFLGLGRGQFPAEGRRSLPGPLQTEHLHPTPLAEILPARHLMQLFHSGEDNSPFLKAKTSSHIGIVPTPSGLSTCCLS